MISIYIPSGWRNVTLEQVAALDRTTVTPEEIQPGTSYVSLEHVDSDGSLLSPPKVQPGDLSSNKFSFGPEHVLYGKLRPYLKKIALPDIAGICTTEIIPLKPGPNLDRRYLYYYLRQPRLIEFATERCVGANLPRLSPKILAKFPIPLPPLSEQRRIAAILDKARAIRRKRKEAVELTEELLRSVFLEMFGDPVTNPKGWPITTMGEILSQKPNNGIFRKNDEYGGDTPVVWVKELFSGHTIDCSQSRGLAPTDKEIHKYGLLRGDILFCRSSLKLEGVGYNNVFDGPDYSALFECHSIRASPDRQRVNSLFLNFLLRQPGPRQRLLLRAKTVTMSTIDQSVITSLVFPLPPKSLQDRFEEVLRHIMVIQRRLRQAMLEDQDLFKVLVQQAFKGEL